MSIIDNKPDLEKHLNYAIHLMQFNKELDSGIREIYCFPSHIKDGGIFLLEVNSNIVPELTTPDIPFEYYRIDNNDNDTKYHITILTLTVEQFEEVLNKKRSLPAGWDLSEIQKREDLRANFPNIINELDRNN